MSARRLLLLRHGKSETPDRDRADYDRSLTSRGRKAARLIGTYLANHDLIPDMVLCSPSVRTEETLAGIAEAMGIRPPTQFAEPLYDASTDTYLEQIASLGGTAETLLVIGHNPSTEAALDRLCDSPQDLPAAFPTGALAVIECRIDAWSDLAPGTGALVSFIRPRDLEAD